MKKAVIIESQDGIPGFALDENESILICLQSGHNVKNPIDNNRKCPETAMITTKRIVVLGEQSISGIGITTLTSMNLNAIDAVQYTFPTWNISLYLLAAFLILMYIVPGIIFIVWFNYRQKAFMNVVSGPLRSEVKFHKNHPELLQKFNTFL